MLNRTNCSILKSANKTGLDSTKFTTCTATNFQNNSTTLDEIQQSQSSKLDLAYRKTRTLIDELIEAVQEKKEATRMGIKNFGDTNEYILDVFQNEDLYVNQPLPTTIRGPQRQMISELDLEKLELLKVIENQKGYNQNLERKCSRLQNENNYFKESCASTRLGQSMHPQREKIRPMVPQMMPESSRLFAQLQNLKQENQILRQETIRLLKSDY